MLYSGIHYKIIFVTPPVRINKGAASACKSYAGLRKWQVLACKSYAGLRKSQVDLRDLFKPVQVVVTGV